MAEISTYEEFSILLGIAMLIVTILIYVTKVEIYGIEDSYFHMSPIKGDASQGAFVDIPSISINRYFLS